MAEKQIEDLESTGFGDTLDLAYNGETTVKNVLQNFGMNYWVNCGVIF